MTAVLIALSTMLGLEAIIIMLAMVFDFAVGIRKAAQRGEARTSYGVARTATKLLTYYGAFGVGACIDVLLHVGHTWQLFGLTKHLQGVPVVATIIAIFLCVIELMSIFESADTKAKKRLTTAAGAAMNFASKQEFVEFLARVITAAQENTKKEE